MVINILPTLIILESVLKYQKGKCRYQIVYKIVLEIVPQFVNILDQLTIDNTLPSYNYHSTYFVFNEKKKDVSIFLMEVLNHPISQNSPSTPELLLG